MISDVPIPGLVSAQGGHHYPEIRLNIGRSLPAFNPNEYTEIYYESELNFGSTDRPFLRIRKSPASDYWLDYADNTEIFVTKNASSIWLNWSRDTSSLEDAATYLLGPVAAIVVQIRGGSCLHGSCVAVDGRAVALLGAHSAGKSTTAAAFARLGYPIVSDDVIVLESASDGFIVHPSYPGIRLWESSVEMLFGNPEALPPLSPTWNKRALSLDQPGYAFQSQSLPLGGIFVLEERSNDQAAPFLRPLTVPIAFSKIAPHSWGHYAVRPHILARQFKLLSRLSQAVPAAAVTAHSQGRLDRLCQLLLDESRRWAGTGASVQ